MVECFHALSGQMVGGFLTIWSNGMSHAIKRFVLTPAQAAEKELICDQIRVNPRGPWVDGKKVSLPKPKGIRPGTKKKK